MTRDKVVGYLWEEADTDRARRVLSEAIYVIRKSLGEDAVLAVGDELRLNPAVIWSDVGAFNDAIEANQHEQAVSLYQGPFLDGFFISDALEFEQWAERERDRLARAYAHALQQLASSAEAAGDYQGAAGWWRKLVERDKYAAAPVLGLMRALDAAGDRAAAIQEGRAHAARLKAELEAEPDAQVEAFGKTLRDAAPTATAIERVHVAVPLPQPVTRAQGVAAPRKRRVKKRYIAGLLTVIAAGTVALVLANNERRDPTIPRSASVVAVLPFTVNGEATYLRDGLAQLLSNNLDGVGELRTVDSHGLLSRSDRLRDDITPERAARFVDGFGARYFVLGRVVQTGNALTLTASMYDIQQPVAPIAKASEQGALDSVQTVLINRLTQQLLASFGRGPSQQVRRTAAYTSSSFPAVRAFWTGEEHFRNGRYDQAVSAYTTAVTLDRDFALAYYRLSAAAEWNFEFLPARRNARLAIELSNRLPESMQRVVRAWYDFLNGNYDQAFRAYSNIRALDRTNVEALSGLGEVLVHYNPTRGQPVAASKRYFEEALSIAPEYGEVRFHLLEHAAREKDRPRFDSLFADLPARNPQRLAWKAVQAYTFGDARQQRRVLAELDTASSVTLGIAAGRVAAHTHNFPGAAAIARKLVTQADNPEWKAGAHLLLAQIALGAGDWPSVQKSLRSAEELEEDWTRELSALFLLHPAARATPEQILAERAKLEAWDPGKQSPATSFFFAAHFDVHDELRLYLLGLLSAAAADLTAAERYRSELTRAGRTDETRQFALGLARSLQGHIARAQGDRQKAIQILQGTRITTPPELIALSPFYARTYDRFVLAELTGDKRWSASLDEGFDFAWVR